MIGKLGFSLIWFVPVPTTVWVVIYANNNASEFALPLGIISILVTMVSAIKIGDIWNTSSKNKGD